jgi:hypothetical protein
VVRNFENVGISETSHFVAIQLREVLICGQSEDALTSHQYRLQALA